MLIEIGGLSVRFGGRTIFDQLHCSLQWSNLRGGNVIALMGPSGSGKTTFARALLKGRYEPGAGANIHFAPADPVIAYLPQEPVLFDHIDLVDNARLLERVGRYTDRFDQELQKSLAKRLRLASLLETNGRPDRLSGGEAQRLMLLRMLSVRPDLIILDEPASGLDAAVREAFMIDLQEQLERLNIAALYVTHHWEEARFLADRVAYLAPDLTGESNAVRSIPVVDASSFASAPPSPDAFKAVYGPGCSMSPLSGIDEVVCFPPTGAGDGKQSFNRGKGEFRVSNSILSRLNAGARVEGAVYRADSFVEWREISPTDLTGLTL